MAALLKSLFFVFNISFLPKYRVKYYDYKKGKVVDWDMMQLVCIVGYFINFSFKDGNSTFHLFNMEKSSGRPAYFERKQ